MIVLPLLLGRINPSSRVARGWDRITPASAPVSSSTDRPESVGRDHCHDDSSEKNRDPGANPMVSDHGTWLRTCVARHGVVLVWGTRKQLRFAE